MLAAGSGEGKWVSRMATWRSRVSSGPYLTDVVTAVQGRSKGRQTS